VYLDMLDDAEPADLAALAAMGSAPEREAAMAELTRRLTEWSAVETERVQA
jgi:hypothetical protein